MLGVAASGDNLPSMAESSSSALTIVLLRSPALSGGSAATGAWTASPAVSGFAGSTGAAESGNFSESFSFTSGAGCGCRSGRPAAAFEPPTGLGDLTSSNQPSIARRRNALDCPSNDPVNNFGKARLVAGRQILTGQFVLILLSVVGQDSGYPREISVAFDKPSPRLPIIGKRRHTCPHWGVATNDWFQDRRRRCSGQRRHHEVIRARALHVSAACPLSIVLRHQQRQQADAHQQESNRGPYQRGAKQRPGNQQYPASNTHELVFSAKKSRIQSNKRGSNSRRFRQVRNTRFAPRSASAGQRSRSMQPSRAAQLSYAPVTRQITSPTSSAIRSERPSGPTTTPTGRP